MMEKPGTRGKSDLLTILLERYGMSLSMKTSPHIISKGLVVFLFLLAPALQQLQAEPSAGEVSATELATLYHSNPQAADAKYIGKKISIKGRIKELQFTKKGSADTSTVTIVFETPLGTPAINIDATPLAGLIAQWDKANKESAGMSNFRVQHELKFSEGHVSVRLFREFNYESRNSNGYNFKDNSKSYYGKADNLVSVGDDVTITGVCAGKSMDISITDSSF